MNSPSGPRADQSVVARVFERERIWRLTEHEFAAAVTLIGASEPVPDVVIGIARGGVPLARRLAEHYGVPVAALMARHNHSDELYVAATGRVELPQEPDADLAAHRGARLLLVDDICGTGATYRAAVPWLHQHLAPASVRTAVLCRSQASAFTPDTWVWSTLDWVVFPWNDPAPTTEDLIVPDTPFSNTGPMPVEAAEHDGPAAPPPVRQTQPSTRH